MMDDRSNDFIKVKAKNDMAATNFLPILAIQVILALSSFAYSFPLIPSSKNSPQNAFRKSLSLTMSTDETDVSLNPNKGSNVESLDAPTFTIQRVTCDTSKESPTLREGVAELFKLYFDELFDLGCDLGFQGFQSEWTDLPGKYDFKKRGGLFVAIQNGSKEGSNSDESLGVLQSSQIVGCIAIRPLTESCGEVKRMYIRKSYRRNGLGKKLALAIIEHAWSDECNFDEIKLDSLERLADAVSLYEKLGFERISPYCECPEKDHVCMNTFKSRYEK